MRSRKLGKPRTGLAAALALCVLAAPLLLPASSRASLIKHVTFPKGVQTTTVRWSHPNGLFVVGLAFEGNTFWAQGSPVNGWRWGYLGGEVHYCVWIRESFLPSGGSSSDDRCGAARSDPPGTPPAGAAHVWTSPSGKDGVAATIDPGRRACGGQTRRYANASPWSNPSQVTHPMGPIIRHRHKVRARYLTGDGRTVMVHDPALHIGGYPPDWYFVPASCMRLPKT
jgi:hypothetical protein